MLAGSTSIRLSDSHLVISARASAMGGDLDIQQLLDLLDADAFASLHRAKRPPQLLARAGVDAAVVDDAIALLDANIRFERQRRAQRERMDMMFADADGREAQVTGWTFPLDRDAVLLIATEAMPPALLGWIEAYVELWWRRRCEAERGECMRGALDDLDLGVMVLDVDGDISFANVRAEQLLESSDGLRRLGGSIGATVFDDAVRLQTAIGRALHADAGRHEPSLLMLRRAKGRPLVASVVRVAKRSSQPGDPAAVVYVLDPDANVERLLDPVCDAYHLTATEARLTRAIVAGTTLAEAAGAQRIRLETARSYLKQIFAKTGTHRQAELVRVMLSAILRAGPTVIARR